MRLRLLAITWIMIMLPSEAANIVERNRRAIGSSLTDSARKEDFDLFGNWRHNSFATTTTEADSRAPVDRAPNSKLTRRPPRKSLENIPGPEFFQDPNDIIDPESLIPHVRVKRRANYRRSIINSPSYVHRVPRRTYERFLSEEMNPADESEAEYGGSLDDDVDVPGVFLDDETTMKRNSLQDVYPEVNFHPVKRDHSPPEFLIPASAARPKRDKERDGECVYEDDGEEYYYDDEDETSNQKSEERASQAIASKAASPISAAKEAVDQSQSNQENMQTFDNGKIANIKEVDYLNSPVEEKYVAVAAKSKPTAKEFTNSRHKNEKPKPKKKPHAPKQTNSNKKSPSENKPPSQKHITKDKTRPMPKLNSKINKKQISNVVSLVDSESDQLNQKGYAKCCGEETAKETNKGAKTTLVIKAIPKIDPLQESQIYEKPSGSKQVDVSKPTANNNKADMSMGEMNDLLTRLIVKVDDLHSLVSGLRSDRAVDLESNSNRINCVARTHRHAAAAGG